MSTAVCYPTYQHIVRHHWYKLQLDWALGAYTGIVVTPICGKALRMEKLLLHQIVSYWQDVPLMHTLRPIVHMFEIDCIHPPLSASFRLLYIYQYNYISDMPIVVLHGEEVRRRFKRSLIVFTMTSV